MQSAMTSSAPTACGGTADLGQHLLPQRRSRAVGSIAPTNARWRPSAQPHLNPSSALFQRATWKAIRRRNPTSSSRLITAALRFPGRHPPEIVVKRASRARVADGVRCQQQAHRRPHVPGRSSQELRARPGREGCRSWTQGTTNRPISPKSRLNAPRNPPSSVDFDTCPSWWSQLPTARWRRRRTDNLRSDPRWRNTSAASGLLGCRCNSTKYRPGRRKPLRPIWRFGLGSGKPRQPGDLIQTVHPHRVVKPLGR